MKHTSWCIIHHPAKLGRCDCKQENGSNSHLSVGLDARFFMAKRLPHLLNMTEELLTWCIEEDKKRIWSNTLKKYREEYDALMEEGI